MTPKTQQPLHSYSVKIETPTGKSATLPVTLLTPKQAEQVQVEFKRLAHEAGIKGARIDVQRVGGRLVPILPLLRRFIPGLILGYLLEGKHRLQLKGGNCRLAMCSMKRARQNPYYLRATPAQPSQREFLTLAFAEKGRK